MHASMGRDHPLGLGGVMPDECLRFSLSLRPGLIDISHVASRCFSWEYPFDWPGIFGLHMMP